MSETTTEKSGDAWETVARAADSWARMEDAWATSVAAGVNNLPEDIVAARDRAASFRRVAAALRAQPALTSLVAELAALKTWDELSALTGGTARPESSPFALDGLILRARAIANTEGASNG